MYETYAGYARYAKHACLQSKACNQIYGFNKVLQTKQISPIWDAMRSCFLQMKDNLNILARIKLF